MDEKQKDAHIMVLFLIAKNFVGKYYTALKNIKVFVDGYLPLTA